MTALRRCNCLWSHHTRSVETRKVCTGAYGPTLSTDTYIRLTALCAVFDNWFVRDYQVSRYQKGKTNVGFTGARDSEWQWHQLGRMQVYTSLQTDNHASTPPLSFYRPHALPAAQPTALKYWRPTLSTELCGIRQLPSSLGGIVSSHLPWSSRWYG